MHTWKFRLVLNFAFDCSEPEEIASSFSKIMQASEDMVEHPKRAIKDGWEIHKEYSRPKENANPVRKHKNDYPNNTFAR